MVTKTTVFGGLILVTVGLVGFAAHRFMGMHLGAVNSVVYIFSGVLALYFGLKATPAAARSFCLAFGALYGLLGLAGFFAGGHNFTLTIIPGTVVLGIMDHLVHLVLGVTFLLVGWAWRPAMRLRLKA